MKPGRLNLVSLSGLGLSFVFACAITVASVGSAHAESESGGFVWGAGSESGGVAGAGASTESGGETMSGTYTESGGALANGASTLSGGEMGGGEESESGGVVGAGTETESGYTGWEQTPVYVKNYKW